MSPHPDLAEYLVHLIDIALGVACAAFLLVAAWAVASEIRHRRRLHAPLWGPWPAAGTVPGTGPAPTSAVEARP